MKKCSRHGRWGMVNVCPLGNGVVWNCTVVGCMAVWKCTDAG
jgi:hypothetical protein